MLAFSTPALADTFDTYESPVFEAPGTHQEITRRAQLCVAQLVRNDQFNHIESGLVVIASDPDAGQVIANSRTEMRTTFMMSMRDSLQSTLSVLAKDGRFKITHSKILFAVVGSGGYDGLHAKSIFVAKAKKTLDALDESLAACIQKPDAW